MVKNLSAKDESARVNTALDPNKLDRPAVASVAAHPTKDADTRDYAAFGAGLIGPDKAKAGEVVQRVGS